MEMFSWEQLEGIFLAIGRPELTIYRNEKKHIGYEVRIRVNIRADNIDFLTGIKNSLEDYNINSHLKTSESKVRPKPILWVSGISNIVRLCNQISEHLPSSKSQWDNFRIASLMVYNGEHTTQEGLDNLLKLKGEL